MSTENLSQAEIVELAGVLGKSGCITSEQEDAVRVYDLVHPDKLSKSHLRALRSLLGTVEKSWSDVLTGVMKTDVSVTLCAVDQVPFSACLGSVDGPQLMAVLSIGSLSGSSFLSFTLPYAFQIVERMTGGQGGTKTISRPLTSLECSLVRRVADRFTTGIAEALRPTVPARVAITELTSSVGETEIAADDTVIAVSFNVVTDSGESRIELIFPAAALEPVRDMLTSEHLLQSKKGPAQPTMALPQSLLQPVRIDIAVELGKATMSMRDIAGLAEGDVIRLDGSVEDLLDLSIGGNVKFRCHAGTVGKKIAVQIMERVEEPSTDSESQNSVQNYQEVNAVEHESAA